MPERKTIEAFSKAISHLEKAVKILRDAGAGSHAIESALANLEHRRSDLEREEGLKSGHRAADKRISCRE